MIEDCKSDDPDVADVRHVSSPMGSLRAACRTARPDRPGWADEVRAALARVLADDQEPSPHTGRMSVAAERVLAAVDTADLDALRAAVDRLETLDGTPAHVPDPAVRATAPGPPGTLMP
ncbi:hypothetical protein GCM10009773_25400 [Williamsia serinedens]